jgi:pyrroline-5-carboxylate reductase
MGSAILAGVVKSCAKTASTGAEPRFTNFIACVNSEGSAKRLESAFSEYSVTVLVKQNVVGMEEADVVMLGCKPYMIEDVLGQEGVTQALDGKLLISFLAGRTVEKIKKSVFNGYPAGKEVNIYVTRAMMNIAAEYGESMTVIEDVPLPGDYSEITNWIFEQLGTTAAVPENLFDVAGVVAAPSIVFLSVALDGMLDGAVHQGIKRAEARRMLGQSLIGLAKLLENGDTPDILREKFSSPRGTTIEGLMALEADGVRSAYTRAIIASTKRSQEM